jgi:hypothetical protein
LLALLGVHPILHISRIRVNWQKDEENCTAKNVVVYAYRIFGRLTEGR